VKSSQARTGHRRGMGGRWTEDDGTHERHTQTHTLTTDTPPADTATHPRVSELHSTSLKARVYCRAPPALLGQLEPLARPRTFPEPSGSRLGPFPLGQIAAYPICTLMTLGFLSLLPRRQVAGLSLAGTHTHTPLTHAHWALHFECRGAPVV